MKRWKTPGGDVFFLLFAKHCAMMLLVLRVLLLLGRTMTAVERWHVTEGLLLCFSHALSYMENREYCQR